MKVSFEEIVEWLEHGRPSDYVIKKESHKHLIDPMPITDKNNLDLSLNSLVRFIYPNGIDDIEGILDIYKDMIKKFKELI